MQLNLTGENIAVRQQAITWANVDPELCRYMVSLGLNELMQKRRNSSALPMKLHLFLH